MMKLKLRKTNLSLTLILLFLLIRPSISRKKVVKAQQVQTQMVKKEKIWLRTSATIAATAAIPAIIIGSKDVIQQETNVASFIPLRPWQLLNVAAFFTNMWAVSVRGRIDGEQASPQDSKDIRFFTPAGWAFAIWGPIFLGELIFSIYQLFPSVKESLLLPKLTPFWLAAMGFQSIWCSAFRPWAVKNKLLWIPASLLTATCFALGGVNKVLCLAARDGDLSIMEYFFVQFPLSLHFGWITAASLVSWNGVLAASAIDLSQKIASSFASTYLAVILGSTLTLMRQDPLYAFVISWALAAVADERGWGRLKGSIDSTTLQANAFTAKGGSCFMGVVFIGMALLKISALFGLEITSVEIRNV